jgi:hypothetical protein
MARMRRLVLLAKRPRLGRVKTRLVPPLDAGQALALYRAFLDDQLSFLGSFASRSQVELCLDDPEPGDAPDPGPAGQIEVALQGPGDLGQRLLRAFQRAWRQGARATVVIGADAPTLPEGYVTRAFRILDLGAGAVVGPAVDGGYVLLGLQRPLAELFRDVPWGTAGVCRVTVERARDAGIEIRGLDPWYDVDDREALLRLRDDLADPVSAARAPRTAEVLARLDWTRIGVL